MIGARQLVAAASVFWITFSEQTRVISHECRSIAGRVTKSDGTTGISSASIRILLGSIAASTVVTDGSGNYSSPSLSPGTYSIEVSATGYAMQSRSGITVVAGATSSNDLGAALLERSNFLARDCWKRGEESVA